MKQELKTLFKIAKNQQIILKKLAKESKIDLKFKSLTNSIINRSQMDLSRYC